MNKRIIFTVSFLVAAALLLTCTPLFAEDNVQDLKKQIELLQKRVEELESSKTQQEDDDRWGFFNNRQSNMWDPFAEMHRMQNEMNRMFQSSFSNRGWSNGGTFSNRLNFDNDFDVKETDEGYRITFDMAGFDKEKVDIQINDNSITVKGEQSREETNKQTGSYFSAQSYGSFMRTIPVPEDADTTKVKTEKEGDNLIIILPKKVS